MASPLETAPDDWLRQLRRKNEEAGDKAADQKEKKKTHRKKPNQHRPGSMKWLAPLVYVVLMLPLSDEHLGALLWWSEPGAAEAVVQHAILHECRRRA
ncbi:hypothetical protein AK812_SmicGene10789 [Symbiodinium microadriaticum]|uniref:Uncharacterized protein n=1 Tax=Symbiodinium microadriaticum TaxID=2951 RepID=A0A1Q9EES7_SYMMI|nr:hypothetical protein AK812_SmicGene10789 [Symbiodinium microadriaticum]